MIDAKMLDKLRALRSTNFKLGKHEIDREKWREIEQEIHGRHTDDEIEDLKRHGFAGVSLEARAARSGNRELYDLAYWLYSGHTHATEVHEHVMRRLAPDLMAGFEETLAPAVREVACNCLAVVVLRCNELMGSPVKISG